MKNMLAKNEKSQLELRLKTIEQEYNIIKEHSKATIWIMDTFTFKYTYISSACKHIYGYDVEEYSQLSMYDILSRDSLRKVFAEYNKLKRKYYKGEIDKIEATFDLQKYHKDGHLIWIEVSAKLVIDENGKLTQIIGHSHLIDDRKKRELELEEIKRKWKILSDNTTETVFLLDITDFSFRFMSDAAKVLGYTAEETKNIKMTEIFPPESIQLVKEYISEEWAKYYAGKLAPGKLPTRVFEVQQYHKDGNLIWTEITGNALPSTREDGKLTQIIGTTRNIDDKKTLELKLLEQNLKLEYANSTKDKFFSIIAHDLRNPITAMINIASVFNDHYHTMDPENITRSINILFKSTANISNLLENLLQWSRSSIGTIEFNSVRSNINEIVNISFEDIGVQAQNKSIKLVLENKTTHDVYCDPNMVNTILRNLISNAIKFSSYGKSIYIIVDDYLEDNKYVVVSVKDEGVGMAPDALNKLFKLETKASTDGTEGEHGTGLGLILCKEFIDKHNCKIWVESEIGKGATFNFTLLKA